MKRPTDKSNKNTLFRYFSQVKQPTPERTISSILGTTSSNREDVAPSQASMSTFKYFNQIKQPATLSGTSNNRGVSAPLINSCGTSKLNGNTNTHERRPKPVSAPIETTTIDLTLDDDNDLMMISDSPLTSSTNKYSASTDTFSRHPSTASVNSSQGSDVYFGELKNTSKFNKKGWSAEDKDRGPVRSSQDSSLSKQALQALPFNKIPVKPQKATAKANYKWVGPNDVAPYSSNYVNPNKKNLHTDYSAPRISVNDGYSSTLKTKRDYIESFSVDTDHYSSSWASSSKKSSTSSKPYMAASKTANDFREVHYISSQESVADDHSYKRDQKSSYNRDAYAPTKPRSTSTREPVTNDYKSSIVDDLWLDEGNNKLLVSSSSSNYSYGERSSNQSLSDITRDLLSSDSTPVKEKPDLSAEQQCVFDMVVNQRQSLFFTGSAGTGKSVLLRAIIEALKDRFEDKVAVTASTGIAACNINGCTLHSFAAIGMGNESAKSLTEKITLNKTAKQRWRETRILIIDEISMVDAELFDKLDYIAKKVRGNPSPFGGLQVVVTGDFFQLPPVSPDKRTKFAFEANAWKTVITKTVMLTRVFRQKDGTFIRILNEMRLGKLSDEAIRIFKQLSRTPEDGSDIAPTELYPLRAQVDSSNNRRLNELPGKVHEFRAVDFGDQKKNNQCIAPQVIQLKKNAQVMLLKNVDIDLVNGSIGVVVGFSGQGEYTRKNVCELIRTPQRSREMKETQTFDINRGYPIVKFVNGRKLLLEYESWTFELPNGQVIARRSQIPLMLAWAISIHKSQGQTLDKVRVDLQKVFEKGQAYVALSRATRLESLQILNFDERKVMAHPTVTEFYKTLQAV